MGRKLKWDKTLSTYNATGRARRYQIQRRPDHNRRSRVSYFLYSVSLRDTYALQPFSNAARARSRILHSWHGTVEEAKRAAQAYDDKPRK